MWKEGRGGGVGVSEEGKQHFTMFSRAAELKAIYARHC